MSETAPDVVARDQPKSSSSGSSSAPVEDRKPAAATSAAIVTAAIGHARWIPLRLRAGVSRRVTVSTVSQVAVPIRRDPASWHRDPA
ncbi:hypothetical protein GCM10009798_28790 [Nocardioides panacihumi]|uniref:Uncharacterized protein n=1 Tax=Nocardioides panacihumi TaxID=400774 RepID=A0ABP5CNR8_9ACTN